MQESFTNNSFRITESRNADYLILLSGIPWAIDPPLFWNSNFLHGGGVDIFLFQPVQCFICKVYFEVPSFIQTHLLVWEQQELDYSQMADYSMTKQLGEFAETSSKKQLSRHKCHGAWLND